ncbi:hypothetical protein OH76DRAFT_1481917 [Lentinus brumalis]|uniref:Uncharacterized protein n=1 Tax=Lentinus brumalis TaxID=2498619 RepID=A0A371DE75_9APHY|nr:hypothetical protein OH76DRAFT_1481917 [Polyporus brumalis]
MNCNIPSFNALRRSITALRALEELDIWDATTKSRVGKPWVSSSKYAPGPQLRMFKLVGPQDEHVPGDLVDVLMHWLSNHTSLKELHLSIAMRRELSVTVGSPFGPGLMAFFQSGAASSVSSLSMDIMEGRYNPISYFTSLSSLTLSSDIDLCISSLWAEACAMLNDLRSPIRYLRFTEVLYHEPQTPCPAHSDFCFCLGPGGGIAELDAVLSRDVFRDLIRVEFHLRRWAYFGPYPPTAGLDDVPRPRIERSELLDRTKESLPQLFAAGVVLVAFTESW